MSSRRTLILIAAIAVGALAAFAIFNYVGGIEDRANDNARRVRVIKVNAPIPQSMTGQEALDQGLLDVDAAIASEFFPPTAVTDVETILTKQAITDLAPNSLLVEGMFVDPVSTRITAARRIPTTHVAVTISVDNVRGVAGLIVPGDFVNMMAICGGDEEAPAEGEPAPTEAETSCGGGPIFGQPARMVYQGVRVLFVDRSPIPLPGEQASASTSGGDPAASNAGLLTLSVPPSAAQLIASVGSDQWYLTLLPEDYTPAALPPFDPLTPTLPGEDAAALTPYGPEGFSEGETP